MPGLQPPSHTLLAALPVVVLDLETTGLNVRLDRVAEIGAIRMLGARILEAPALEQLVNPGIGMPPSATAIHGLRDEDLRPMPVFAEVAPRLLELLAGRVVVGHHVAFDLAVLRHEAARAGLEWLEPVGLDVVMLLGALEPSQVDLSLEAMTRYLGVDIGRRHRAMGDCLAAAHCYAQLLGRLREVDVRTLGEAQSLAARRTDLMRRQVEAGWHSVSGEVASVPAAVPSRIDAFVFERSLAEVMSAPPVFVRPGAPLREAAQLMIRRRIGALLVGDPEGPPVGVLTERDLLRMAADGKNDLDGVTVDAAMSAPVRAMNAAEMLYRALGYMDRLAIRHLCVLDAGGRAVGMVSQRDLLHHRARGANALGAGIQLADDASGLASEYGHVAEVAGRLRTEGVGGVDIARVVSNELRAVTARAAAIAAAKMESRGRGGAPVPWCVMVLGSGGRGESLLGADQDNALVHSGSEIDDAWFAEFGALLAELLDETGVPRCRGGVMAANAQWRGSEDQWRSRVRTWLGKARPQDLLNVDIFFDMMPVAGAPGLARTLHAEAVQAAATAPTFIALLAESVSALPPIFGFLGRLRSDQGRIDLKRNGLLPLVGMARTLALRCASGARSTPERLRDALAAGRLAESDAADLLRIHDDLLSLIVRQQIADLAAGVRPSSRVAVKDLEPGERRRLERQLHRIDDILGTLRSAVSW
jgi:CBS domain-containing protein